jgi:phosphohistidine phosphatase SixA
MTRFLFTAALAMLAACTTVMVPPGPPNIYVMRHLQKAEGADPPLAELGRANAALLPDLVLRDPPRAIYVSATRRARETAAPLAVALGIVPQEYDPRDTPALLARLRAERHTVLVVGHSNTVPDIVEGMGGRRPDPIDETTYGWIYYIYGPNRLRTLLRADVNCMPLDVDDQGRC